MFKLKGNSLSVLILAVAGIVRGILGLISQMVIAAKFGTSSGVDAFLVALTVPMLFGDFLIGGTVFFAFIPLFIDWKVKKGEEEAWHLAINFMLIILFIISLCTVIYFIFARQIILLIAPGFSRENLHLAFRMARLLSSTVLIFCLTVMMRSLLYTYKEFLITSVASLLYPISVVLVTLFAAKKIGIYSLVWGALVGACLQFILQFFQMCRLNKCIKFKLDLMHTQISKVLILSLPLLGVMIVYQINQVIMRAFASTLGEGSIAALNYAYQLINVPLSILAFSIGTAMFPDMSEKLSQGNLVSAQKLFSTSIRMALFLMIPISVGFGLLSYPLIKLIFERGSFTAVSTLITSRCFFFYTLGLFALALNTICIRAFYALKDMVTPLKIGILGVGINIILALFLKRFLGAAGLALAFSLYVIVSSIILLVLLDIKVNMIKLKEIVIPIAQILIISLVMALSVWLAYKYTNLIISVITGIAVFTALSFIMKMEEIFRIKGLFMTIFFQI